MKEDGWLKILVTAAENPRIDPAFLEEKKRVLCLWVYSPEYECQFVGDESQLSTLDLTNPD
jgi:hypothetical protein